MMHEYSLEQLSDIAKKIIHSATHKILLFDAAMGVGKTTLIKEICQQLGVKDTISSPTYSIVNEYQGKKDLIYHFDFYRIKDEEEAYDIGFEEYITSNAWVFIEWPDKIKNLLPPNTTTIEITVQKDGTRHLEMRNG